VLELIRQWRYTRMVTLTALVAAIYAAVLIPFKLFPIIPGFTEARPGNALPILFSFPFGPAAAWGAALGNTVGDFFGTLGVGTLFGFVGNLAFGYVPYRLWAVLGGGSPVPGSPGREGADSALGRHALWWVRFLVAAATASLACSIFISWPVDALDLAPFRILAPVIFLNNFLVAAVLAPPLLLWVYPRVERMGLLYTEILDPDDLRPARAGRTGLVLLAGGLLATLVVGVLVPSPTLVTAPFVVLALVGILLI